MSLSPSEDQIVPRKAVYFIVEHSDKETIHVNANCILKLIYEYIRLKARIPDDLELDLCDDDGVLKKIYEAPEGASGLDFFEHKHIYYIIIFERTKYGTVSNPRVLLTTNHRYFGKIMRTLARLHERHSENSEVSTSPSFTTKFKKRLSRKK